MTKLNCTRCVSYFRQLRSAAFSEYVELGEEILREQDETLPYKAKEIREKLSGNLTVSSLENKSVDEKLESLGRIFPNTRVIKNIDGSVLFSIENCQLRNSFKDLGLDKRGQREIAPCFCHELALFQGCFPNAKIVELENVMLEGGNTCTWKIAGLISNLKYEQKNICPLKPGEKCPAHTYASLAARYFLDYMELFKARKGISNREQLDEKLYDIRFASAEKGGKDLRALSGDQGLAGLVKYYWSKFPTVEIKELSEHRLVCRANSCAFKQGYVDMGISSEEMKKLSRLGCICDEAAIKGYNPAIRFQQEANLMNGDEHCQWILTLDIENGVSEQERIGKNGE